MKFSKREWGRLEGWAESGIENALDSFGASGRDFARDLIAVVEALTRLEALKPTPEDIALLCGLGLLPEDTGPFDDVANAVSWGQVRAAVSIRDLSPSDCFFLQVFSEGDAADEDEPDWVRDLDRLLQDCES